MSVEEPNLWVPTHGWYSVGKGLIGRGGLVQPTSFRMNPIKVPLYYSIQANAQQYVNRFVETNLDKLSWFPKSYAFTSYAAL